MTEKILFFKPDLCMNVLIFLYCSPVSGCITRFFEIYKNSHTMNPSWTLLNNSQHKSFALCHTARGVHLCTLSHRGDFFGESDSGIEPVFYTDSSNLTPVRSHSVTPKESPRLECNSASMWYSKDVNYALTLHCVTHSAKFNSAVCHTLQSLPLHSVT